MQKLLIVVLFTMIGFEANAQVTRNEVTMKADPATDLLPNDPAVPDVYTHSGAFDRILIVRAKYQSDLLSALETAVRKDSVRDGVILAGIGSVRNYRFHVVSNRTFPTMNEFVQDSTGPADIAGMNGYIINGRVHAHISFANGEKMFGGHLEAGTNVFTFAIVTIGVLNDAVNLDRVDDKSYR
jgi:predicted DNA-binding protein with PD1-like motif